MVTPRKLHPKQRGRKTANKMPMFVMRQNNKSNDDGKLLKFLEQFDDTGIAPMEQLTDQQMYDMNMAAAEQALQLTLKDPEQRDHFTKKLREDGWPRPRCLPFTTSKSTHSTCSHGKRHRRCFNVMSKSSMTFSRSPTQSATTRRCC